MRITWFGLAEGVAEDARGATTLIGINQNVFATNEFPSGTKRAIILYAEEGEDEEQIEGRVQVKLRTLNPEGEVVGATSQTLEMRGKQWPSVPGSLQLTGETQIQFEDYGEYVFEAELQLPTGETLRATRSLYVVDPDTRTIPDHSAVSPTAQPEA